MDFEIKEKSKVKVKIYGQEYALTKPTLGQIELMQDEMESQDAKKSITMLKNFLDSLGFPKADLAKLEVQHITKLVEFLCDSKKN